MASTLEFRKSRLDWSRPYVMGILNLTPDSFSDGGRYSSTEAALRQAERMVAEGADLLDLGGESTRPNATPVGEEEECRRVLPVIEELARRVSVPISIDTTKAAVARRAIEAGAEIVNDISGGLFDPAMFEEVAALGATYICGHVRGDSIALVHRSKSPRFEEVGAELAARLSCMPATLRARTIADPCIGFGKSLQTNLELLRRAGDLADQLGVAVLLGPSRKRFLGEITGEAAFARESATVGACLAGVSGGAHMLRVHDVAMTSSALQVFWATIRVCA